MKEILSSLLLEGTYRKNMSLLTPISVADPVHFGPDPDPANRSLTRSYLSIKSVIKIKSLRFLHSDFYQKNFINSSKEFQKINIKRTLHLLQLYIKGQNRNRIQWEISGSESGKKGPDLTEFGPAALPPLDGCFI